MLNVADVLAGWLAQAPDGGISLGSETGKSAVKALAEGWNSRVVRVLASQPLSLTEIDRRIPSVSYPSLERRLARMRAFGQVTPGMVRRRGTPYEVTDWLRRSVAPLSSAGYWEQRYMRNQAPPMTNVEIETILQLALPLVRLSGSADGSCLLAAAQPGTAKPLAGVTVDVQRGHVKASVERAGENPSSWALGAPEDWLDVIVGSKMEVLRIGGSNPELVLNLVHGIHLALSIAEGLNNGQDE
jgi:DNA-binding HxlR family transcriptional regulator